MKKWTLWLLRWFRKQADRSNSGRKEVTMDRQYDPQALMARVKEVLAEMQWRFGEDAERLTLSMAYGGKHGILYCILQVHAEQSLILFYAHVQCRVPEEKRLAMAEFVTRANCGLWLGNFELDFRDGEIRYKTSLDVADGELTGAMLASLIHRNCGTVDRYLPGIMSVLWNDVSPEDAIGLAEAA
jgi:hypothetical protein